MTSQLNQQQQYRIKSAVISADRFQAQTIDIAGHVVELAVFESIEKPYVTAQLLISDDNSIVDGLQIRGGETITFEIEGIVQGNDRDSFTREFCIACIERTERANDRTDVHLIKLIDKVALVNASQKISKSFNGKIEDIIVAMINGTLGLQVDTTRLTPSSQPPIRCIVPYMTPFHAADWLRDRMSTSTGGPAMLFAKMYNSPLVLASLEQMISTPPFNTTRPFVFSQAYTNYSVDADELARSFVVRDIAHTNYNDNLNMVTSGSLSNSSSQTDVTSGNITRGKARLSEGLTLLYDQQTIPYSALQTLYDPLQRIGNQSIDEINPKIVHTVVDPDVYPDAFNYHDAPTKADMLLKNRNHALRNALLNNMMQVSVHGMALLAGRIGVGDTARFTFLTSSSTLTNKDTAEILDKNKSGDYLIYNTVHVFSTTEHKVNMDITKLSNTPRNA